MSGRLLVGLALSTALACAPAVEAPPGIRNIVLISIDALGARHVGAYGYPRATTPRLDRQAQRGTLFENAVTNQVWTLTSHLTMQNGLYPQAHGASEERPAAAGATALAEILSAEGFETAAFTGVPGYMRPDFGLGRGFGRYELGDQNAELDNRIRLAWIDQQASRRADDPLHRFFMFAHYYDVHSDEGTSVPYAAPEPHGLLFLGGELDWERRGDTGLLIELQNTGAATARDLEVLTALYDGAVHYTDQRGLAPLLDALDDAGFGDDTLVIVTSDHGEEIFEHGKCSHQQPYAETAAIPLVVWGPGIAVARRVAHPAQLVDLMPTILALLALPVPGHVQGQDLSPWLRSDSEPPEPERRDVFVDGIFGGIPHVFWRYPSSVTGWVDDERYSYVDEVGYSDGEHATVFEAQGRGELYRLRDDPDQHVDLAARHPEIAATLRGRLLSWYAANDRLVRALRADEPSRPAQRILSEEERRMLEALGYVR